MSKIDEAYWAYAVRCHGLGIKPMNPAEYEKFIYSIPTPMPNKIDAILMNNNPSKDRPK